MANYGSILSECLQSPFNIERYRNFVVNFLEGTEFKSINGLRSADYFAEYSYYVQGYALVGEYTDPKRNKVGIFAVKLKSGRDIEKARSKQRNFIARLIADYNFDAALAAFYLDEESKWRLSFVRLDYEFVKGKVSKSLTPAKRYSYLVGKDEPCHTAQESLLPIFAQESFTPTIDSIEQAFSIEKVTKQFFETYKEKYIEVKEYLEGIDCFIDEAKQRGFSTEQFAKKLMGQIVFLYFLQKKGWLGVNAIKKTITEAEYKKLFYYNSITSGFAPRLYIKSADGNYTLNSSELTKLSDKEEEYIAMAIRGEAWGTGPRTFVRDLFNVAQKKGKNFYDDYLEPLFYEGLNQKRKADNYYARLHCRIPFLNGGLFEPLDNYDWENNSFSIPNEMFSNVHIKGTREADGILDIFDRYNFTMNEDEPLEKEVAVDPEMLGKIFENLLDVSDRKSKGAFYTPREIVHYMCQESLANYLVNTVGTPYEDTKDFIVYGEIMKDEDCSRESIYGVAQMQLPESIYKNLKAIDDALADVRVADPAVGSGAFPMGMLSEIVKLREIITEYMARELCLLPQYRGTDKAGALRAEIWKLRNQQRNSYKLKKETMRNSIYAVDIEPSAVDIAKLRLWLTLVVEQEIDVNDPENDRPITLPNLDCNIMCGNSLIDEFEGIDLSFDSILFGDGGQSTIWSSGIDTALEQLFVAQKEYFYANNHEDKQKYKDKIDELKDSLISLAFTSVSPEKKARFDIANGLHSTPFFLWKLNFAKVFKDKGGFDIVIGNPPYGAKLDKNVQQYYRKNFTEVQFKIDSYVLFILKGLTLCNSGCLSYIIPNTLLNNYFLATLRRRLISDLCVERLINFDNSVFDAVVHSLIIEVSNRRPDPDRDVFMAWNISEKSYLTKQNYFMTCENYNFEFTNGQNSLLDKLKKSSIRLEEVLDLRQAIKTGDDKKYITTEPVGNAKKILRGKDVNRYSINNPHLYLDYGKHLACPRDEDIFNQPHILIREAGSTITASLDYDKFYIMSSLYCGILKNNDFSIEYLMGLINSKLFQYLMWKINFENTQGAFTKAKIYHYNQLPIITPSVESRTKIEENVSFILSKNGVNAEEQEIEIDQIVYNIYNLTPEEIALVEESVK